MQITLSNIIECDSVVLGGRISANIRLTNEASAIIIMHPSNTKPQWILKTGFWNDAGVWDDSQKWID